MSFVLPALGLRNSTVGQGNTVFAFDAVRFRFNYVLLMILQSICCHISNLFMSCFSYLSFTTPFVYVRFAMHERCSVTLMNTPVTHDTCTYSWESCAYLHLQQFDYILFNPPPPPRPPYNYYSLGVLAGNFLLVGEGI